MPRVLSAESVQRLVKAGRMDAPAAGAGAAETDAATRKMAQSVAALCDTLAQLSSAQLSAVLASADKAGTQADAMLQVLKELVDERRSETLALHPTPTAKVEAWAFEVTKRDAHGRIVSMTAKQVAA